MEKLLSQLVEKLQKAHGERLISVVLHGSAASGDYQPEFSGIDILCVFAGIGPRDLAATEEISRWWKERGKSTLLLMEEREVAESAECFAVEFTSIQGCHRLLYGKDVVSSLAIGRQFYRAQVEHDLRANLLRLRRKAAGTMAHPALLRRLLLDSVSTFCILFRHALALRGVDAPPQKREVMRMAREHFRIDASAFEKLLDVRDGRIKARAADPVALLGPYMEGVREVIAGMER
jgi:predicted nucleotidyltransferase